MDDCIHLSKNVSEDRKEPERPRRAERKKLLRPRKVAFAFLFVLSGLLVLTLLSSEWVRWLTFHYYLDKKKYGAAEEILSEIIRKRKILGQLDRNFVKEVADQWRIPMKGLIEREMGDLEKEWNHSRSFFPLSQSFHDKLEFRFERIQALLEPGVFEGAQTSGRYSRLLLNIQPYSTKIGLTENDVKPEKGVLDFECSGGVALDYNSRSLGANFGKCKKVAAIRLRRWTQETRVKPENLSLWISNDNQYYEKYDGPISYAIEEQAMTLDRLSFTCQYLKVHCDIKDEKYTFAEDAKRILEIYGPPEFD